MAKTNLRNVRVLIESNVDTGAAVVTASYNYDSSDGDPMSRSVDITGNLSAAQRTSALTFLTNVTAAIKTREGIA